MSSDYVHWHEALYRRGLWMFCFNMAAPVLQRIRQAVMALRTTKRFDRLAKTVIFFVPLVVFKVS